MNLKSSSGGEKRFFETIWPHFDQKFELSGFTAHFQDLARRGLIKSAALCEPDKL